MTNCLRDTQPRSSTAMSALMPADAGAVRALCASVASELGQVVEVANINSHEQVRNGSRSWTCLAVTAFE